MARTYARISVALWANDDDFRGLSVEAQHLYFVLLSQPGLNLAGVFEWRPKRLVTLASGWTLDRLLLAAEELIEARFIVLDASTEEAVIRSFVNNDVAIYNYKMAAGMAAAWGATYSPNIRGCISEQVRKAISAPGNDLPQKVLLLIQNVIDYRSDWATDHLTDHLSHHPTDQAIDHPIGHLSDHPTDPPATKNLKPTTDNRPLLLVEAPEEESPDLFDEFWSVYPRKVAKGYAQKAWVKAIKTTDPSRIIAIARAYAQKVADEGTDRQFIPHPSSWINGQRWDDEEKPAKPTPKKAAGQESWEW